MQSHMHTHACIQFAIIFLGNQLVSYIACFAAAISWYTEFQIVVNIGLYIQVFKCLYWRALPLIIVNDL